MAARLVSRSDSVLNLIKKDIAGGVFPTGSHLGETELARRYGVSRTPVREALRALAAIGVVERSGRKGCKVAPKPRMETCPTCGSDNVRKLRDEEGTLFHCRACGRAWEQTPRIRDAC